MVHTKKAKILIPTRTEDVNFSFEETWGLLAKAIDAVYMERYGPFTFESIYRLVYMTVVNEKASDLYTKLKDYVGTKLESQVKDLKLDWSRGMESLKIVVDLWDSQNLAFDLISDLFLYLDKVYCKPNRYPEVFELCLQVFKDGFVLPFKIQIFNAFIETINESRRMKSINEGDAQIWHQIARMMQMLEEDYDTVFNNQFEPFFLDETEKFYDESFDPNQYPPIGCLEEVKRLKDIEYKRDLKFLDSDTTSKLTTVLEKVLIWKKLGSVLLLLVNEALKNDDFLLLQELFDLSSNEQYKQGIIDSIKKYILQDLQGKKIDATIRKKVSIAIEWVSFTIEKLDHYTNILRRLDFGMDKTENNEDVSNNSNHSKGLIPNVSVVNEVFASYLDQNKRRAPEFICFYLDSRLKWTQQKKEIQSAKEDLERCVKLFKLLSDKDLFEAFYRQQLPRRLLHQRSSIDIERWLIKRIKEEMGVFFTSKLEGMLRDIATSNDLSNNFKNAYADDIGNIEYIPQILTITSWPFSNSPALEEDIIFPSQLQQLKLDFEALYSKKYNQRSLKWDYQLSLVEIGYQFEKSYHELSMSVYGALILLLFEDRSSLTTEMIEDLTHIPKQELHNQLLHMASSPKGNILNKLPASSAISPLDIFSINESFSVPTRKYKVLTGPSMNIPSSSSSRTEPHNVIDNVEKDRIAECNAAIVRIMKQNKEMGFEELYKDAEASTAKRFALTDRIFKKSVKSLLDKEYLRKEISDSHILHYIP